MIDDLQYVQEFEQWYLQNMGIPLAQSWRKPAYGDLHVLYLAFVAGVEAGMRPGCMPVRPPIWASNTTK